MEVDTSMQIPYWVDIWLSERKYVAMELAREGHVVFYNDFVTLHCASYYKGTRNLLLQRVIIKGKQVVDK